MIKRFRKLIFDYLPIAIGGEPYVIKEMDVAPGKDHAFHKVDDETMVLDANDKKSLIYVALVIVFLGILISFSSKDFYSGFVRNLTITIVLAGPIVFYALTIPRRKYILNRLKGTITYPGFMWGHAVTIPFSEALVNVATIGWPPTLGLNIFHPNKATTFMIVQDHQLEVWNLFVWYMDKNRPLPPGKFFDPYRRKDYERRKAEGFPKPLYHSLIETPEYVPEENGVHKG